MRTILTLALLAVLTGCGHKHVSQVSDVTKSETIILTADRSQRAEHIYNISLRYYGDLDGTATISGKNVTTQRLTGAFDIAAGGDWYSGTCQLLYSPTNVRSGRVSIAYEFHD